MTKEELLDKAIYWFKCIAEDMERITSGNLSRNAAITKRRAIRTYEFLENHKNDTLPSNIDEAIDKYTDNHANYLEYSDDGWEDKTDIDYVERAFKAGAEWMQSNLWHPADGDDLPELEREVVVFTQKEGLSPKVGIAHRPDPKGWYGTSISTGKTEHFEPMLYGKGGWSLPDVKIWLDCKMPFKENEV